MHQVEITDGNFLRRVLRTVLEAKGTHRAAAEWLGIGQTTFTRQLNGNPKGRFAPSMAYTTYASIKRALEENNFDLGLEDPLEELSLRQMFEFSILTFDKQIVEDRYNDWLEMEFKRLEQKAGIVFLQLWGQDRYRSIFVRFLGGQNRGPQLPPSTPQEFADKRIWLALYRAVEPLADAEFTWHVERFWQEYEEAGELDNYLKLALKRESMVLDRDHDLDRIRAVDPPDSVLLSYVEWEPTQEEIDEQKRVGRERKEVQEARQKARD